MFPIFYLLQDGYILKQDRFLGQGPPSAKVSSLIGSSAAIDARLGDFHCYIQGAGGGQCSHIQAHQRKRKANF